MSTVLAAYRDHHLEALRLSVRFPARDPKVQAEDIAHYSVCARRAEMHLRGYHERHRGTGCACWYKTIVFPQGLSVERMVGAVLVGARS